MNFFYFSVFFSEFAKKILKKSGFSARAIHTEINLGGGNMREVQHFFAPPP